MNLNTPVFNTKIALCIAAATACALLSGPIQAGEEIVTVKLSVSTAGVDPSEAAGARELYERVQTAAHIVCGPNYRVGLRPVDNIAACYETALSAAVRSANLPQITMLYLRTHSPQDAAAHGVSAPVLMAAK